MTALIKNTLALILSAVLSFGLASSPAPAFSDVSPAAWYGPAVLEMASSGLLKGYTDGTFRPMQPITAAEFTAVTARCAGVQSSGQGYWAGDYLQAGLDKGWYDWDEIPPTGETYNRPIQRQLAVKILMRALLPEVRGDYNTEFPKIKDFPSLDGRYYESVLAAYSAGVVLGDSEGRFQPKTGLSRAEACLIIQRALKQSGLAPAPSPEPTPSPEPITGGVAENGWLQVKGTQLCNEQGQPVVLRGMSSHGIQWFGEFAEEAAIRNTAHFSANLFRVAMYTGEGGYLSQPEAMAAKATQAVDAALANDMYVILDWHILSDGNPMDHVDEAVDFFTRMASRYKDQPGVLYEICNEPNGSVEWGRDIKPYAERVVKAIRAQSQGVILIGSSTWSQDVHLTAASPLEGENLMYTLHFYAGTHGQWLRDRAQAALDGGLPLFVSEWGTSAADGNGGVYEEESERWLAFMEQNRLSWANWSLCDKAESSAALQPGTRPGAVWDETDLTSSGQLVFQHFQ